MPCPGAGRGAADRGGPLQGAGGVLCRSAAGWSDTTSRPHGTTPTYVLCPGRVISSRDGDEHQIGPGALAALYGVSLNAPNVRVCTRPGTEPRPGEIVLGPRYDGNYNLPIA